MSKYGKLEQQVRKPLLLFRPLPRDGQCRQDYLMHLAEVNGFSDLKMLSRRTTLSVTDLKLLEMDVLQGLLNGSIAKAQNPNTDSLKPGATKILNRGLGHKGRICPECCEHGLPVPPTVNQPLTLSCLLHGWMLLSKCPCCEKQITYLRKNINFCDCGFDFRTAPRILAPEWVNQFYDAFAPWKLSDSGNSSCEIFKIERKTMVLISQLLQWNCDEPVDMQYKIAFITSNYFGALEKLLVPWPSALKGRLASLVEYKYKSEKFGDFIKETKYLSPTIQKLILEIDEERRRKNSLLTDKEKEIFVSVNIVRKALKLDINAVSNLYNSSYIKSRKSIKYNGREYRYVDRLSFNKLKNILDTTISIHELSEMLDCPSLYARTLIKCGFLTATFIPFKPRTPRVSLKEIEKFLSKFRRAVIVRNNLNHNYVMLTDIPPINAGKCPAKRWKSLFSDIVGGKVQLFRNNESEIRLSSLFILNSDAAKYQVKIKKDS